MKPILTCLSIVAMLPLLSLTVRADNACIEIPIATNWSVSILPTIESTYPVPEPGLTNETMTIYGCVSTNFGSLEGDTYFIGCEDYYVAQYYLWPIISAELIWDNYLIPSDTLYAAGYFPITLSGWCTEADISFVSPNWGDESTTIFLTGVASNSPSGISGTIDPVVNPYYVPFSILPRRPLIYLSFDNSSLAGDRGQLPAAETNVTLVYSPFGKGINFDSTSNILLEYPAFQNDVFSVTQLDGSTTYSSGSPNFRRNEGTLRFWFQPNWSSGSGPAGGGIFFDVLTPYASEIWTLFATNNGSKIELNNAFGGFTNAVNFTANQWYQITVTYSPIETILYTNGIIDGSPGTGVVPVTAANQIDSFLIGSDGAHKQVQGIMDEVKTYNYAMSSSQVLTNYDLDYTNDTDGAGIPNLVQFYNGVDPSDPPGGNPNINSSTASSAPVIQLLDPINAVADH